MWSLYILCAKSKISGVLGVVIVVRWDLRNMLDLPNVGVGVIMLIVVWTFWMLIEISPQAPTIYIFIKPRRQEKKYYVIVRTTGMPNCIQ